MHENQTKHRSLCRALERAARDGHLVLAGAGAEFERGLPYGVWVDALDDYVASQDLALAGDATHELGRVLPSLHNGDGGGAMVADERYRVHRAMRSLLAALSDDQALLLVLDDLQAADEGSILLLEFLATALPEMPALVVALGRPETARLDELERHATRIVRL